MRAADGRVVVVTGGSRGLGAGVVESFLASGDRVATCARSITDEVRSWQDSDELGSRILFEPADLSRPDDATDFVRAVTDRWDTIDVLVNNAGVARDGVIGLAADDDVDTVVDLNIKGTIAVTRSVVRNMLAHQTSGSIVNVSSIVGKAGYRGLAVYSATKAALDGMTRALARELGPRGITVNSIAPGYLRTDMSHGLDEAQLGQIVRRTPVGRLGDPEDIAHAIQFLVDERSRYITGHVLVADGGLTN